MITLTFARPGEEWRRNPNDNMWMLGEFRTDPWDIHTGAGSHWHAIFIITDEVIRNLAEGMFEIFLQQLAKRACEA